ncbi:MAG: sigma-70 family RNA polymerase sigma factor [Bacteroidales bacterium]|nr:sigma-70 family RNA polymerase sigma factor [Bacteroidales bacterium]
MDRTEFNNLVYQHSRKLYGYAFRFLLNQEEAEDAVQEVFIKLWKMGDKLGEYDSIEALATTMTRNYCIDELRKRQRKRKEEPENREAGIANDSSPLEIIENRESVEILHGIIEKLPENYKIVLRSREIEDLSYEEIAEKTGQKVNALRVILSRARKMVKEEYNKHHYERKGNTQLTGKVL